MNKREKEEAVGGEFFFKGQPRNWGKFSLKNLSTSTFISLYFFSGLSGKNHLGIGMTLKS